MSTEASQVIFKGTPHAVVTSSKGWLQLRDANGGTVKARAKDVKPIVGERKEPKKADADAPKERAARKIGNSVVRHFSEYEKHKTATGNTSYDTGDATAIRLRGMELDEIYKEASRVLGVTQVGLKTQYAHLNVGMQRMNLGNRIRGATAKAARVAAEADKAAAKTNGETGK